MMKCVGISETQQLTNCIGNKVYNHCKSCVGWAACKSGLQNVCNCCKRGQCSQSRIDQHLQSMFASERKGIQIEALKEIKVLIFSTLGGGFRAKKGCFFLHFACTVAFF